MLVVRISFPWDPCARDPAAVGCDIVSVCGVSIEGEEGSKAGMSYKFNGCAETSCGDGVTPLDISVARGSG